MSTDFQTENISAFLDGEMSEEQARAFLAEIDRRPEAAAELRQLLKLRELIADACKIEPAAAKLPPAQQARWQQAIRQAAAQSPAAAAGTSPALPPGRDNVLRPRNRFWRAAVPMAATVLIAAGVLWYARRDLNPLNTAASPAGNKTQVALQDATESPAKPAASNQRNLTQQNALTEQPGRPDSAAEGAPMDDFVAPPQVAAPTGDGSRNRLDEHDSASRSKVVADTLQPSRTEALAPPPPAAQAVPAAPATASADPAAAEQKNGPDQPGGYPGFAGATAMNGGAMAPPQPSAPRGGTPARTDEPTAPKVLAPTPAPAAAPPRLDGPKTATLPAPTSAPEATMEFVRPAAQPLPATMDNADLQPAESDAQNLTADAQTGRLPTPPTQPAPPVEPTAGLVPGTAVAPAAVTAANAAAAAAATATIAGETQAAAKTAEPATTVVHIPYNDQNVVLIRRWVEARGGTLRVSTDPLGEPLQGPAFLGMVSAFSGEKQAAPALQVVLPADQTAALRTYVSGLETPDSAENVATKPVPTADQPPAATLEMTPVPGQNDTPAP